jgi:hypothetical protein
MTAAFTVECNSQTVLQQLAKLTARFEPKGMRPVMMEIGETLSEATKRRFDAAVAPDETPWLPLKEGTVLARIQRVLYNYGRPGLKKSYANKQDLKKPAPSYMLRKSSCLKPPCRKSCLPLKEAYHGLDFRPA